MNDQPTLGCPFCDGQPDITKHFKEQLWALLHRCPVIGAVKLDWTEDPANLRKRWNTRKGKTE